jgi:hypothetical protein
VGEGMKLREREREREREEDEKAKIILTEYVPLTLLYYS